MNKIALITDLHFGARNDSALFHDYYESFYSQVFFPHLIENKITSILCGGDMFDKRKQINFVSLDRANQYFFHKLKEYKIHMYALVGNHDAPFKHSIKSSSPRLLLGGNDYIDVIDEPQSIFIHGKEFMVVPWVCNENEADTIQLITASKASILVGHLELAGFEMFKGQIAEHGTLDAKLLAKFDRVWSGHYHHRSSKGNIQYLGNPYEMTWSDYDDPRGFHVYDVDDDLMEFIQNPFQMFHKVIYDDTLIDAKWVEEHNFKQYTGTFVKVIVTKKQDFLLFDQVIYKVQEAGPAELKIIEDFSEFEEAAIEDDQIESEDTLTLLNAYIDGVTTEVDTDKLKKLMHELYLEANINE